jgi:hypothetical protein
MKRVALFVVALGLVLGGELASASAGPLDFSDNFEGSTLNPFWNDNFAQSGSITFPSTLQAHTGTQSVQLNSIAGNQIDVFLQHDFATPIFGTVSVWVYDTPALQTSGNYIQLYLRNNSTLTSAQVQSYDYNLGPGNGGNYYVTPFGGSDINSGVARTPAWHEFQIIDLPNSLILSVDGTQVYSGPAGTAFDLLRFGIYGPSFRPGETEFVDDFSFTQFTATPEPATLTLLAIGIAGMAGYGWRRRKPAAA